MAAAKPSEAKPKPKAKAKAKTKPGIKKPYAYVMRGDMLEELPLDKVSIQSLLDFFTEKKEDYDVSRSKGVTYTTSEAHRDWKTLRGLIRRAAGIPPDRSAHQRKTRPIDESSGIKKDWSRVKWIQVRDLPGSTKDLQLAARTHMERSTYRLDPTPTQREVKETVLQTFERIGGIENYATWAKQNQDKFYEHYIKILPLEIKASIHMAGEFTSILEEARSRLQVPKIEEDVIEGEVVNEGQLPT
jgi:hypothetical protein